MVLLFALLETQEEKDKLTQIYLLYRKIILSTAYGILHNNADAEDASQNTLLKILKYLDSIGEVECHKTLSFIVIITKSVSLDLLRKRKRLPLGLDEEILSEESIDFEELIVTKEKALETARYLKQVHPPYAEILELKYYQDLKDDEIADILCISEGNVRKRLSRARYALKKFMADTEDKEGGQV